MIILLDNGHGLETPGKRSPDGHFREYAYNRYLAFRIREQLTALGLDARLLVPEREDISIHVNAAGNGQQWMDARGWNCFTTAGQTKADALATYLYEAAKMHLPGHQIRKDYTDGDPDIEKNFYILRHTSCPAVLTENLFMDNRDDVALLESAEGSQAIVDLHVEGICRHQYADIEKAPAIHYKDCRGLL